MAYWVNVDQPTNSEKIHRDNCRYAVPYDKNPKNGGWYYFRTIAEVRVAFPNASGCQTCNP